MKFLILRGFRGYLFLALEILLYLPFRLRVDQSQVTKFSSKETGGWLCETGSCPRRRDGNTRKEETDLLPPSSSGLRRKPGTGMWKNHEELQTSVLSSSGTFTGLSLR